MTFIADLHIHSKYSRATAKNLDLENLYATAQIKGLSVVGTGDFTFPAWGEEIESKLEETEPGLFSLKQEIATKIDETIPASCRNPVRFILQTEISNIYKRGGRVRKNHNLIYFPDFLAVKKFNARLDALGNIRSDGRPILGLDARALLEIMLETSDQGFFVPAHIWTPWFSMLGSKSGFETIEDCFGDLKQYIFAVETGLSSDPPMNWRVSDLDHVSLISNSDAHSPGYLGRNATVFNTDLDYFSLRSALESQDCEAFNGTLDMFPHQGKYHYDGHRKCSISLNPETTAKYGGICPVCKKPLTLGVLHRVQELADRREGFVPENRQAYTSIIPLADILSEIFEVGPKSKRVTGYYQKAIEALGPELFILTKLPIDRIKGAGVPLLAEAVMKMRKGDIRIDPGFDGEYGKVNIFSRQEKQALRGEKTLSLVLPSPRVSKKKKSVVCQGEKKQAVKPGPVPLITSARPPKKPRLLEGLNPGQKQAVESKNPALLIQAGPGTGKTRTLTAKIAWLISEKRTDPKAILALTFTNKAAQELTRRIDAFLPKGDNTVLAGTFHGVCLKFLKEMFGFNAGLMEDRLRLELIKNGLETIDGKDFTPENGIRENKAKGHFSGKKGAGQLDRMIALCKQQLLGPTDDLSGIPGKGDAGVLGQVYAAYQQQCLSLNLVDFEELIFLFYRLLKTSSKVLAQLQKRFSYIFVDEYQDLNLAQYELVKLLAQTSNLVVIGDPDQSIYGFRGSDNRYFKQFAADYPGCEKIFLDRNYRSTQTILDASFQMISQCVEKNRSQKIFSNFNTVQRLIIKETATEKSEAVAVGKMIEKLMGGLSFFSMDTGRMDTGRMDTKKNDTEKLNDGNGISMGDKEYSFSDIAILFRTKKQGDVFAQVFEQEGIPFQTADKTNLYSQEGIRQVLSLLRIITGRAHKKDHQILTDHFNLLSQQKGQKIGQDSDGRLQQIIAPVYDQIRDKNSIACLEAIIDFLDVGQMLRQNKGLTTVYETLLSLARLYPDPEGFMDYLVLEQDPDHLAGSVEKVSLMTLHSAKGLEYPVVFVTGCEQGLIPFARDGKICDNLEEERRLFYVGMTRAMDILCLTYARKRRIYGVSQPRQRSFFIDDIEKKLARYETSVMGVKKEKREIQLELFE